MCNGLTGQDWTKSFKKGCGPYIHSWTSQSCQYKIQIQPSGYMSIVDEERKRTEYELNNENYFLLRWTNDNFPKVSNNGGCGAGCVARGTSCLCNIKDRFSDLLLYLVSMKLKNIYLWGLILLFLSSMLVSTRCVQVMHVIRIFKLTICEFSYVQRLEIQI